VRARVHSIEGLARLFCATVLVLCAGLAVPTSALAAKAVTGLSASLTATGHLTSTYQWTLQKSASPSTAMVPVGLGQKIDFSTLATYSNLNHVTGYQQKSFDISAFAGQTIRVSFSGPEDFSLQTSFVIDDTALTVS
jgi:hypothetical protein